MAVDSGGLRYPIRVDDEFSKALDTLLTKIAQVREGFAGLAQATANLGDLGTATRRAAQARQEATGATENLSEAEKEYQRLVRRTTRDLEVQEIAQERGTVVSRKRIEAMSQETVALGENRRELDKLRLAEERERLARSDPDLLAARKRREERLRLSKERREIAAADLQAGRQNLARLQALEASEASFREAQNKARVDEVAQIGRLAEARRREQSQTVDALAVERIESARKRLEIAQAVLDKARSGVQVPRGEIIRAQKEIQALNGELARTNTAGNRISFTFRRLFGILAAFAVARSLLRGLRDAVLEAIRFNQEIEKANLGIASIIVAIGNVRRPTGEVAEGAEALSLALEEAKKQTTLLRAESIKTTASLEDLVETFQVAIAPGLQAGLNLDQIRKFTIEISQAATAIGLSQTQLAEEIRSILQGTIRVQQTRIAAALGISNEDVRRAKELGEFAQFLDERFRSFSQAGEESLNTFNGILAALRRNFSIVLGESGKAFFNELKSTLKTLADTLVSNQDGILTVNPAVVSTLRTAFGFLKGMTEQVRILVSDRGFGQMVKLVGTISTALSTVQDLSTSLLTAGTLASPLIAISGLAPDNLLEALNDSVERFQLSLRIALERTKAEFRIAFLEVREEFLSIFGGGEGEEVLRQQIQKIRDELEATILDLQREAGLVTNIFDGLPLVLGGARRELEEQGTVVSDLKDDLEEVEISLRGTLSTLGAQGAVLEQNREILKAENEQRLKTKELLTQESTEQARLAGIQASREGVERKIAELNEKERANVERQVGVLRQAAEIERRISDLRASAGRSRERAADFRIRGLESAAVAFDTAAQTAEQSAKDAVRELDELRRRSERVSGTREQSARQKELNTLAQQRVVLAGQEQAIQENIEGITEDRVDLEDLLFRTAATRIREIAALETEALKRNNREREAQILAEEAILRTRRSRFESFTDQRLDIQLAQAQALIVVENRRLEIAQEQVVASLALARRQAEDARLNREGPERIKELDEEILALEQQSALLDAERVVKLGETVQRLEEIKQVQGDIFREAALGVRVALAQFNAQTLDIFQTLGQATTTALEGIVDIGKGLFASIFDPQANFSIREALGRLALQIGQDLFASAVRNLILSVTGEKLIRESSATTAALILTTAAETEAALRVESATLAAAILTGSSAAGGFTSGVNASLGSSLGLARGGQVDRLPHLSSRARGFARGTRPAHIPASDSVPAWLTPGEWVMRLQAVRRYGEGVMDSINRGLVDPALLRSVASHRRSAPMPAKVIAPVAMAGGGQVPSTSASGTVVLPAVTVDERTMAQLLANRGAQGALRRWLSQEGVSLGGQ